MVSSLKSYKLQMWKHKFIRFRKVTEFYNQLKKSLIKNALPINDKESLKCAKQLSKCKICISSTLFHNKDTDIAEVRPETLPDEDVDTHESSISNNLTSTIEDNYTPHSLIVDFDSSNNSFKLNNIINSMSNSCNVIQSKAKHTPLNEFSENDDVLSRAFLNLFLLGYSCSKKDL